MAVRKNRFCENVFRVSQGLHQFIINGKRKTVFLD